MKVYIMGLYKNLKEFLLHEDGRGIIYLFLGIFVGIYSGAVILINIEEGYLNFILKYFNILLILTCILTIILIFFLVYEVKTHKTYFIAKYFYYTNEDIIIKYKNKIISFLNTILLFGLFWIYLYIISEFNIGYNKFNLLTLNNIFLKIEFLIGVYFLLGIFIIKNINLYLKTIFKNSLLNSQNFLLLLFTIAITDIFGLKFLNIFFNTFFTGYIFFYIIFGFYKEITKKEGYVVDFYHKAFEHTIYDYKNYVSFFIENKISNYVILYNLINIKNFLLNNFNYILLQEQKPNSIKLNIDQPIESQYQDEDILGHKEYAKNIFDLIYGFDMKSINGSYSIGVVGEWGIGKSGIINMIKNDWMEGRNDMVFYEFNPWNFEKNDLVNNFFSDLSKELKITNIGSALTKYASIIGNIDAMKGYSFIKDILSFILPEKSIHKIKEEINDKLKIYNKKIIISIDDLDRCTPDEVMMMLNIIKNLGNFKNIIYLVSYDKENVLNVLKSKDYGEDYLDKIINHEIYIPSPDYLELKKIYDHNINIILKLFNITNSKELLSIEQKLSNIFKFLLAKENLRMYKKYFNTIFISTQRYLLLNIISTSKLSLEDSLYIIFVLNYFKVKDYIFYNYIIGNRDYIVNDIVSLEKKKEGKIDEYKKQLNKSLFDEKQKINKLIDDIENSDEYYYKNSLIYSNYRKNYLLLEIFGFKIDNIKQVILYNKIYERSDLMNLINII